MKWIVIIVSMLIGSFVNPTFGQSNWVMTYKSGKPINGATLGYGLGKVMVYGGMDILSISYSGSSTDTDYSWDWENEKLYRRSTGESSYSASGSLYIPHIGGRIYLVDKLAKGYILVEGFIIVPALDYKDTGSRKYYAPDGSMSGSDSWDYSWVPEENKNIKDLLDYMSLMVGFGSEFELSPAFSIGSEFGLRIFFNSAKTKDVYEDDYNTPVQYREISENEIKSKLMGTFTTLSLNYRF